MKVNESLDLSVISSVDGGSDRLTIRHSCLWSDRKAHKSTDCQPRGRHVKGGQSQDDVEININRSLSINRLLRKFNATHNFGNISNSIVYKYIWVVESTVAIGQSVEFPVWRQPLAPICSCGSEVTLSRWPQVNSRENVSVMTLPAWSRSLPNLHFEFYTFWRVQNTLQCIYVLNPDSLLLSCPLWILISTVNHLNSIVKLIITESTS